MEQIVQSVVHAMVFVPLPIYALVGAAMALLGLPVLIIITALSAIHGIPGLVAAVTGAYAVAPVLYKIGQAGLRRRFAARIRTTSFEGAGFAAAAVLPYWVYWVAAGTIGVPFWRAFFAMVAVSSPTFILFGVSAAVGGRVGLSPFEVSVIAAVLATSLTFGSRLIKRRRRGGSATPARV